MSASFDTALSPAAALAQVAHCLEAGGVEAARRDARHLLLHALDLTPVDLALGRRAALGAEGAQALSDAVRRRLAGEPVARILGAWEFWGLPFALGPETLVPRPDTETVVEAALALVADRDRGSRLLDLGTGSGCILIALLAELPGASGVGLDLSAAALALAHRNAAANGVGARALFVRGAWCAPVRGPFDLIVANPPYIASAAIPGLDREVRAHDPPLALDGGPDGLGAYRAILGEVAARPNLLGPGGSLVFEVGHDQAEAVRRLAGAAGLTVSGTRRDLAGNERVVTLQPTLPSTVSTETGRSEDRTTLGPA